MSVNVGAVTARKALYSAMSDGTRTLRQYTETSGAATAVDVCIMVTPVAEASGLQAAVLIGPGSSVEAVELDLVHRSVPPDRGHVVMGLPPFFLRHRRGTRPLLPAKEWWAGTGLNSRHQDFQFVLPTATIASVLERFPAHTRGPTSRQVAFRCTPSREVSDSLGDSRTRAGPAAARAVRLPPLTRRCRASTITARVESEPPGLWPSAGGESAVGTSRPVPVGTPSYLDHSAL
jgi:hypothetical protein